MSAERTEPRIWAMHGVVESRNRRLLSHLNFLERSAFEQHLKNRPEPYVDLSSALRSEGAALTIDDATTAAFDAAELARDYGHGVTVFINPYNILAAANYFFAVLCMLIDRTACLRTTFLGETFALEHDEGRLALRQRVKRELLTIAEEDERWALLQSFACSVKVEDLSLPGYFRTLKLEELSRLSRRQVEIGNHGWTHGNISALSPAQAKDEITRARDWIRDKFGAGSGAYAVPFGACSPPFDLTDEVCSSWLLNQSGVLTSSLSPRVYNRKTLKLGKDS